MKTCSSQTLIRQFLPLVAIALLLATSSFSTAQGQGIQGDIQWHSSVEKAKEQAQRQNKLVLLHFGASWCRPCKALDTYVFKSSQVKKAIAENVVPVRLDADRALDIVNEYDVSMVPFDVIITPGGRVVTERRSPSDADNYAKMISGTATASRNLAKEKMGPIAHQRKVVKNDLVNGQDTMDFRATGPSEVQVGLSKDSSLLQRRQTAFSDEMTSGPGPKTQSNPFTNPDASLRSSDNSDEVAIDDLERKQFLSKDRNWVAPSAQTRRAEPKRIVNKRYFDSIAQKENGGNGSSVASDSHDLGLNGNGEVSSANGDFKIDPSTDSTQLGSVMEIGSSDKSPLQVSSNPPQIDRQSLCLKGKCPVTLITEGRWEDGDTRFGIVHRNRTYIFANAEKLAQFRSNPDNYSPILAGYDPVVYREQGKLVEGLAENGVFMGRTPNQKVILFKNAATRSKFQMSPQDYLETIRQATNDAGGTVTR
jgi:thiol-disulfide isomerase/thioredoxin